MEGLIGPQTKQLTSHESLLQRLCATVDLVGVFVYMRVCVCGVHRRARVTPEALSQG